MFTGQRFLLRRKKKFFLSIRYECNPLASFPTRFSFFSFFHQEFERKRERERKRWRVSTFSRCRITIGNALQGGVKKHRSAKKHYKGNNVVSSGCSTYSFHVRFFFFFCFDHFDGVFFEILGIWIVIFETRWKMKFLSKIISIVRLFLFRKMPLRCFIYIYIYISLNSDSPMIF